MRAVLKAKNGEKEVTCTKKLLLRHMGNLDTLSNVSLGVTGTNIPVLTASVPPSQPSLPTSTLFLMPAHVRTHILEYIRNCKKR